MLDNLMEDILLGLGLREFYYHQSRKSSLEFRHFIDTAPLPLVHRLRHPERVGQVRRVLQQDQWFTRDRKLDTRTRTILNTNNLEDRITAAVGSNNVTIIKGGQRRRLRFQDPVIWMTHHLTLLAQVVDPTQVVTYLLTPT